MPDWIIHLGIAYIIGKLAKIKDLRLLLLGAILPDILSKFALISKLIINKYQFKTFLYSDPLHTPFMVAFLALTIALFNEKPKKAFGLLLFGSVIHIILDIMQKNFGFHKMLLYPFNYATTTLNIFWLDSSAGIILFIISGIAIFLAIIDKNKIYTKFDNFRNIKYAIPLIAIILITPLITLESLKNYHYFNQIFSPEEEIRIGYGEIISENPLTISVYEKIFILETEKKLKTGNIVSLNGIYKNGKIIPKTLHVHKEKFTLISSFIGFLAFIIIWFFPILKKLKR